MERSRAWISFPLAFVGSLVGAQMVQWIDTSRLRWIVALLLGFALALMVASSRIKSEHRSTAPLSRSRFVMIASVIAASVGFYDGFFGPGTGTLLIAAYVTLLGDSALAASANAKVANFASNVAAVVSFGWAGAMDLRVAAVMGVAQLAGSALGARTAMKRGSAFVRPMVLGVACVLLARVVWQIASA